MKNILILCALASIMLLQGAWAASPCKPGWVEPEDCVANAIDPAGGNCYLAEDNGSCVAVPCATDVECAENCYQCLQCLYNYGCCTLGNPTIYPVCYANSASTNRL